MTQSSDCKMPDIMNTEGGDERRVGIEIELSGLGYDALVKLVARCLDTEPKLDSRYVTKLATDLVTSPLNWIPTRSRIWIWPISACLIPSASWAARPWK